MIALPPLMQWNGMMLIVSDEVPPDGYVLTDSRGDILAGGNITTGAMWRVKHGDTARVYATEKVARELISQPERDDNGPCQ